MVVYNGTPYSYVKNLQGDIVGILDSNKNVVVSYVYDAWGRPISCLGTMANTLGKINPFRYRGYVYDEETGLYYLRSRYYNVHCARFVNADYLINTPTTFSCNGFCYCSNNPSNDIDSDGTFGNGTIHYEVCTDIVARNPGIYMNLTKVVPGRNGSFGLCDLVSDSGQIWEVKRVTCAPLLAVKQLKAYLSSTFQNRPGLIDKHPHLGKRAIAGRMFLSDSGYIVCYMDTGTGFILYHYSRPNLRTTPEEVTEKLRKRIESRAPNYATVSAPVPVYASEPEFSIDWNGILEVLAPVGVCLSLAAMGGCAFAMQKAFNDNESFGYSY